MLNPVPGIERFDLDVGVELLDRESILGVLELPDLWRARARLRSRWLMRAALDALPDFHLDQIQDTFAKRLEECTMNKQCPRCLCTPHVGPCAGFYPGWAEHHTPTPGSERPYTGLGSVEGVQHTSDVAPTPEGRLSAANVKAARELAKFERLAR